jgi:DNA-binding PadR family transcriptional regulator
MASPTYFVLASLLDGPRHGYAIFRHTEELSGGRVRLATGTTDRDRGLKGGGPARKTSPA